MKIRAVSCVKELRAYLSSQERKEDWQRLVVDPHWEELCCFSPYDLSNRKLAYVPCDDALFKQTEALENLDISALE